MDYKFALKNFNGDAVDWYESSLHVTPGTDDAAGEELKIQISHHIFIIDRSGSMYSILDDLKHTLMKILTLEEYRDAQMNVSLLSYASKGDLKLHFERVSIQDVMKTDSPQIAAIKAIRVAGVTCISQALEAGIKLIDDDEFSAISIHSDGFANDSSYKSELSKLEALALTLQDRPVIINTIAHSSYSDFNLLSRIANLGSGSCVLALDINQVYNALHDTSELLLQNISPALPVEGGAEDFWTFVSQNAKKLVSKHGDGRVLGLTPEDDQAIYRFKRLTEAEFDTSEATLLTSRNAHFYPLLAVLSRSLILKGRLNSAKYCMLTSKDAKLLTPHANALTSEAVGRFAMDLEQAIFKDSFKDHERLSQTKLNVGRHSVLKVLSVLNKHKRHITVDKGYLDKHYHKRTLGKIVGTRNDDGSVTPPEVHTQPKREQSFCVLNSIDINRNAANINMTLSEPIDLLNTAGEKIERISGIDLSGLKTFRSYTVVGDGRLNLAQLKITINSKTLYKDLSRYGVITGEYEPGEAYVVNLSHLPLVDFKQGFEHPTGLFSIIAHARMLKSVFSAMMKDRSEIYTDEQLAELKRHHLTPQLNLNLPMTSEHSNLDDAINSGRVDLRISYQINLGTDRFTALSKLPSANAFLQSQYVVSQGGQAIAKPKCHQLYGAQVVEKTNTKDTSNRALLKPLFDDLLGVKATGVLKTSLTSIGVTEELYGQIEELSRDHFQDEERAVEVLTEALDVITQGLNDLFEDRISPLVFYIGCTGLMPDRFQSVAYSADDINTVYPDLSIGKAEADGMFFDLGEQTLITVYTKEVMFSRG